MPETSLPPIPLDRQLHAALVYAYDAKVEKGAIVMHHPDPPFAAWLVRQGEVRLKYLKSAHGEYRAKVGEWMLLPPVPRFHEMSPNTSLLSVRFQISQQSGLQAFRSAHPLVLKNHPRLAVAGKRLVSSLSPIVGKSQRHGILIERAPSHSAEAVLHGLRWRAAFLEWMQQFLETVLYCSKPWMLADPPREDSPIRRAMELVNNAPLHRPLRLRDLASATSLSESHLKRLFAGVGMSPAEIWAQRLWAESRRLLRQTDTPVKRIAADLGFRSPAHFSTWFRKRANQSPCTYREASGADA